MSTVYAYPYPVTAVPAYPGYAANWNYYNTGGSYPSQQPANQDVSQYQATIERQKQHIDSLQRQIQENRQMNSRQQASSIPEKGYFKKGAYWGFVASTAFAAFGLLSGLMLRRLSPELASHASLQTGELLSRNFSLVLVSTVVSGFAASRIGKWLQKEANPAA